MSDKKEPFDNTPVLEDVSVVSEKIASNPIADALFSDESLGIIMAKVSALESLLNTITRDCKFNEFIQEVLMIILRIIPCEAASIFEVDYANQQLFFRAVVGRSSDRVVDFTIPLGQGIAGHVAESRSHIVVDNVPENKMHLKSIENAVGFTTKNLVAFPFIIRGKVFGVVELLNRVGEANFTTADMEIITYLCQIISKAIEIRLMLAWANQGHEEKKRGKVA